MGTGYVLKTLSYSERQTPDLINKHNGTQLRGNQINILKRKMFLFLFLWTGITLRLTLCCIFVSVFIFNKVVLFNMIIQWTTSPKTHSNKLHYRNSHNHYWFIWWLLSICTYSEKIGRVIIYILIVIDSWTPYTWWDRDAHQIDVLPPPSPQCACVAPTSAGTRSTSEVFVCRMVWPTYPEDEFKAYRVR